MWAMISPLGEGAQDLDAAGSFPVLDGRRLPNLRADQRALATATGAFGSRDAVDVLEFGLYAGRGDPLGGERRTVSWVHPSAHPEAVRDDEQQRGAPTGASPSPSHRRRPADAGRHSAAQPRS